MPVQTRMAPYRDFAVDDYISVHLSWHEDLTPVSSLDISNDRLGVLPSRFGHTFVEYEGVVADRAVGTNLNRRNIGRFRQYDIGDLLIADLPEYRGKVKHIIALYETCELSDGRWVARPGDTREIILTDTADCVVEDPLTVNRELPSTSLKFLNSKQYLTEFADVVPKTIEKHCGFVAMLEILQP